MDSLLGNHSSKTEGGGANHNPAKDKHGHHAPTTSELMESAKVVSEAAKAQMANKEYDQGKAAGAAANILNAASHYGKLDESTGLGKIVDKAEDYLQNYSTTSKTTTTTHGDGKNTTTTTLETTTHTAGNPADGGHGKSGGGGYGEYVKMAEGLLKGGGDSKAHGGDGGGKDKAGGGYGDIMKMAGDFVKKH